MVEIIKVNDKETLVTVERFPPLVNKSQLLAVLSHFEEQVFDDLCNGKLTASEAKYAHVQLRQLRRKINELPVYLDLRLPSVGIGKR